MNTQRDTSWTSPARDVAIARDPDGHIIEIRVWADDLRASDLRGLTAELLASPGKGIAVLKGQPSREATNAMWDAVDGASPWKTAEIRAQARKVAENRVTDHAILLVRGDLTPDEFYANVAAFYLLCVEVDLPPNTMMCRLAGISPTTAGRWVQRCVDRGFLTDGDL
jgi:hypothetical protein